MGSRSRAALQGLVLEFNSQVTHDNKRHPDRRYDVVFVGLAHYPGQGELQTGKHRAMLHLFLVELEPL